MTLCVTNISSDRIAKGNYEHAAMYSKRTTYGAPARRAIPEHFEVEKYNESISCKCTSVVFSKVTMSMSQLTFRDRDQLLGPSATCSHQLMKVNQQQGLVQIDSLFGQPCHQHGYDLSHPQKAVPSTRNVGVPSPDGSILDNAKLQQSTPPEKVYLNKIKQSSGIIQNMLYAIKPSPYYYERQTSHHRTGGIPTNAANPSLMNCAGPMYCSNTLVSLTPSYEMIHCSRTSPDMPPLLQLHKKPVIPTFPDLMICAISPRPARSGIR